MEDMSNNKEIESRKVREFLNEIRERIDDFTFDQIYMIEYGLLSELPLELIRFCARPEFDVTQMGCIYYSYMNGLTLEQLQKYITSQLHEFKWTEIIHWAKYDLDFERFVEELGKDLFPKISWSLIREVQEDLIHGLPWERIREFIQLCKEKNCIDDDKKITAINEGILAGLTKEEIVTYIKPEHDSEQVEQIIRELIKKKESEVYKNKEVAAFIKSLEQSGRFAKDQLREIRLGFANGLTIDQVRLYVNEKLLSPHMRMVRLYLQSGYSKEQIRLFVNLLVKRNPNYFPHLFFEFRKEVSLWLRDGLPLWFLDYVTQYSTESSWLNWWRRKLKRLPENQLDVYLKKIQSFMEVWKEANLDIWGLIEILNKLPDEQIEIYSQKIRFLVENYRKAGFGSWGMTKIITEIISGHLYGLPEEQIQAYIKQEFSLPKIEQIGLALLDGLTQEEIEFLANPDHGFDEDQMKIIRLSFKFGLSPEQVKRFAKPEYDSSYMQEFFLGYLWGLPEEAIEFYMNTKLQIRNNNKMFIFSESLDFTPQTILRIALLKGLTIPEIEFATRKFLLQNNSQSDDLSSKSLKSTLEELVTNKEARAKVKALIKTSTELKENWKKSFSETKSGGKRSFTL